MLIVAKSRYFQYLVMQARSYGVARDGSATPEIIFATSGILVIYIWDFEYENFHIM